MTIQYNTALAEMRLRRTGAAYATDTNRERYEKRAIQPAIQYALGAMQEVDPAYTKVSKEEGSRVAEHVKTSSERTVTIEPQGSVPLNTHIRKASDVDMLVINEGFFTYSTTGALAAKYSTYPDFSTPSTVEMASFRKECEQILTSRYPAANVKTNNAKSIQVSGGSIARKVDIVPASWFYGDEYQATGLQTDKEIQIFNKETQERPKNHPFKFMKQVELKDGATQGGLKKSVRLLKNVKNDSSKEIDLSSYDITSLIWNMPNDWLNVAGTHDLAILGNTQAYLDYLVARRDYTLGLNTPDGSRKVIDNIDKLAALHSLHQEVSALSQAVYLEGVNGVANTYSPPSIDTVRQWLAQQSLAL